jgi:hypothetical protein
MDIMTVAKAIRNRAHRITRSPQFTKMIRATWGMREKSSQSLTSRKGLTGRAFGPLAAGKQSTPVCQVRGPQCVGYFVLGSAIAGCGGQSMKYANGAYEG